MGLSFHYNGYLKAADMLPLMIDEVKDFCEVYKWTFHIYETALPAEGFGKTCYDQKMYGISFNAPNCEPVWLSFLSNGRLSNPVNLQFFGNSQNKDYQQYLYMLSVKTQFAGVEVHAMIISLLKYLSKKFFRNFSLHDEGMYWETGDLVLLQKTFKRYTHLLDRVKSSLENAHLKPGENMEDYIERVLKKVHRENRQ